MATIIFVFLILLQALIFHSCSYVIVRSVSSNTLENDRIYLLNRGTAREILENVTVTFLGFDPLNIVSMNYSLLSAFHRNNEPVPKMQMEKVVPDECMRVEILKINTLQTKMLYGLKKVGEYINPAILLWTLTRLHSFSEKPAVKTGGNSFARRCLERTPGTGVSLALGTVRQSGAQRSPADAASCLMPSDADG